MTVDKNKFRAALTFDQIKQLVSANKQGTVFTDECIVAVCWKESTFNPDARSTTSTAKGLMQMTDGAVKTVNDTTPPGVHFEPSDMLIPAKSIQCGTYYLNWCSSQSGGDEGKALDKYGGVSGYSGDVMTAEACLLSGPAEPMSCLTPIHLFEITRSEEGLSDNPTGLSRFERVKTKATSLSKMDSARSAASTVVPVRDEHGNNVELHVMIDETTNSGQFSIGGRKVEFDMARKAKDPPAGPYEMTLFGRVDLLVTSIDAFLNVDLQPGGSIRLAAVTGGFAEEQVLSVLDPDRVRLLTWIDRLSIPVSNQVS